MAYTDIMSDSRAAKLDHEAALQGGQTVSIEAQEDLVASDEISYIDGNFAQFLSYLRYLPAEDQDLILGYYVIAKTQTQLGPLHHLSQTRCSAQLRQAMKTLAAFMLLGPPTVDMMVAPLQAAGLEHRLAVPLSDIIRVFVATRSFIGSAEQLKLGRGEVRHALREAEVLLSASRDRTEAALGAYLRMLLDTALDPTGTKRKTGDIYVRLPAVLGQFRVEIGAPGFEHVFSSRADHR